MTTSESVDLLLSREQTYLFLARIFRDEPKAALIVGLANTLSQENEGGDSAGYARLRRWAEGVSETTLPGIERELATEYARLLLNTGEIPCFYPCESVYTSSECMMKQEAYSQVLAIYREEGLARVESMGEPEDHVSVEMEFMAHLCSRARSALTSRRGELYRAYLEKQRQFLDRHLLPWVPRFAQNLRGVAQDDFYLAVAEITDEFLRDEPANLDDLTDASEALEPPHGGGSLD